MAKTKNKILDIDDNPLPETRQLDWEEAQKHGLQPSLIRYINGEPLAVYEDGSGIYGPCPKRAHWRDDGR